MKRFFKKLTAVGFSDLLHIFKFVLAFIPSRFLKRKRKNMWLVCEYENEARDNGYWFFRDLRENGFPGLMPEETIIIGDSVTADIRGGRAYGMQTCLYTRGASPDGKENEADHVVTSLEEIKHFL